jgi:hypothetical protein
MTAACSEYCDQLPLAVADFRELFTAFADTTKYPDALIQAWLDICPIDPCIWGPRYTLGMGLWTAHELVKYGPGGLTANGGAGLGGAPTSKSVDSVSIGFDVRLGMMDNAGPYNLTIYGQQFWMLCMAVGAGAIPIQIGAVTPHYVIGTGMAWPGPWPFPGAAGFSS